MKKLKLFTQYELETLFLKSKKQIQDQIGQWPESSLQAATIDYQILALKEFVCLRLPEVNFNNGKETLTEKIFSLSEIKPGARAGVKVKLKVLVYKYELKGQLFLLGCKPSGKIPEPVGEWFADLLNCEIQLEYKWYERNPRKVLAAHKEYIEKVVECYNNLRQEFDKLAMDIENLVDEVVSAKKSEADRRSQLLSLLK